MTDIISTAFGLLLALLSMAADESDRVGIEPWSKYDSPPVPSLPSPTFDPDGENLGEAIQEFIDELIASLEKEEPQVAPGSSPDPEDDGCVTERESGDGWSRTITRCQSKDGNSQSSSITTNSVTTSSTNSTGP